MRVAVQAGEEHVVALPEDRLCAVAVVVVDVEHGHWPEAEAVGLAGGNRSIVEIAIAAHIVAPGMVSWRTTQRKGLPGLPAGQMVER